MGIEIEINVINVNQLFKIYIAFFEVIGNVNPGAAIPNRQTYRENPPKRLLTRSGCNNRLHFPVQAAAGSGIENVAHQAAFAVFFFALGSRATVSFMFAMDALIKAAHRLICACRMRCRPSALMLRRFLAF